MAQSFSLDEDEAISQINVTPLVDVVLVLLIIFMITAPALYQAAIRVELPKAKTGEESKKSPLQFSITRQGELTLGQDPLDWKDLAQKLKSFGPQLSEQTAIISADQGTLHGKVIQLMDSLREAGLTRFALNVEQAAQKR